MVRFGEAGVVDSFSRCSNPAFWRRVSKHAGLMRGEADPHPALAGSTERSMTLSWAALPGPQTKVSSLQSAPRAARDVRSQRCR